MLIDIKTSIYISSILTFVVTAYLLLLWLKTRRDCKGIGLYLIGNSMVFCFTLMLSFQKVFPAFLSVILANTLVISGQIVIYLSMYKFSGRSVPKPVIAISIAIPVILLTLLTIFTLSVNILRIRVLAVTGTGLITNIILLIVMLKARKKLGTTSWFLMASLIILIINAIARILLSMMPMSAAYFIDMKTVQTVFILVRYAIMAFWPFGFAMLILERARNRAIDSSRQKTLLLQELSHRTQNNMDVIISLINWQMIKLPKMNKKEEKTVSEILRTAKNRIQSLALVYKKLYKTENLSQIQIKRYLEDLCQKLKYSLLPSGEHIKINFDISDIALSIESAGHLGLIVNELVTNSLKYAFTEKNDGLIEIKLKKLPDDRLRFIYSDNGTGMKKAIEKTDKTMGIDMIKILSEQQLEGKMQMETDHGFSYSLEFSDNLYQARI